MTQGGQLAPWLEKRRDINGDAGSCAEEQLMLLEKKFAAAYNFEFYHRQTNTLVCTFE
jgi:hypothetical protein